MQLCLSTTRKINRHVNIEERTEFINTLDSIKERHTSFEEHEGVVKDMMNRLESSLLGECLSQTEMGVDPMLQRKNHKNQSAIICEYFLSLKNRDS